jgi:hypothetical protein
MLRREYHCELEYYQNNDTVPSTLSLRYLKCHSHDQVLRLSLETNFRQNICTRRMILQRSGDISGRTTAILQFSSELEQTWHSYY